MPAAVGQLGQIDLPRGAAIVVIVGAVAVACAIWIWIQLTATVADPAR